MTIKIRFTASEIEQLKYERYNHPHRRVQRKMEALLLKSEEIAHKKIAKLNSKINRNLSKYLTQLLKGLSKKDYQSGGIEKLKEIKFYQPKSELAKHQESLESYFRKNPVANINEAVIKIEQLTGIKRSPTSVREFFKTLGIKHRKIAMIPAKADPVVQDEFKKNLEPCLEEAKQGKRAVFFVDATHFVLGSVDISL